MAWTTRKSLINRVLDGDEESWETFYAMYSRLIYAIGDKSGLAAPDCEELVQELMQAIFKDRDRFRYDSTVGKFRTYLVGMVKHKICDFYRKQDDRLADSDPEKTLDAADSNNRFDEACNEEWKNHVLNAALMELREKVEPETFDAFQMYVLQERDAKEVAQSLAISESAVYVYKNRCVKHLRLIVDKYQSFDPEFSL